MQEANSLSELIDQLPVEVSVKQQLHEKLKAQGEDEVKNDIRAIMVKSAALLKENQQAEKLLPEATVNYEQELSQIGQEAADIATGVGKDLDSQDLTHIRNSLS